MPLALRLLPVCTAALFTLPLASQARIGLGLGGVWSSALLRDSVVAPITVRPAIAPSLLLELSGALDSLYRIGLYLTVARGPVRTHSAGASQSLVTITTWEPALRLSRRVTMLEMGVTAGLRVVDPAAAVGVFRDGGTTSPVIGATLALAGPRVGGMDALLQASWSAARFSTTSLRLAGFTGEQTVHRAGLRLVFTRGGT